MLEGNAENLNHSCGDGDGEKGIDTRDILALELTTIFETNIFPLPLK